MSIRPSFKSLGSAVVFLCVVGFTGPAWAGPVTVIDFEDVEPWTSGTFVSSGFRFEGSSSMYVFPPGAGGSINGTQTLSNHGAGRVVMTAVNEDLFELLAFDVGSGNTDVSPTQLFLTAVHANGDVSERVIKLDLIIPDFETVALDGFTDLVSVTFVSDSMFGFALDNIAVVPEPSSILLVLAGVGAVLLRRSKTLCSNIRSNS